MQVQHTSDACRPAYRADPPRAMVAVYIDDIIVKTPRADDLVANLSATFANLKRFNIKLNPEKCMFGIPKGKLRAWHRSQPRQNCGHH